MNLLTTFNQIDVYLFDQLLKGRIQPGHRVLDAGFGGGRNAHFLLQSGVEVHGIDQSEESVTAMAALLKDLRLDYPLSRFVIGDIDQLPYPNQHFDAVMCMAVLHFARNHDHFQQMVKELWRVLRPGGLLVTRLASTYGLEKELVALDNGWYQLPDGTDRYLVSLDQLRTLTDDLGGYWIEDLKTVSVHGKRSMTNWVLTKPSF